MSIHLDGSQQANQKFSAELVSNIHKLSSHSFASSASQLERLGSLGNDLESFMYTEKQALEEGSSRLIEDVAQYVKRMVSDFASQSMRRTEATVTQLRHDAAGVAHEVQELQEHQKTELGQFVGSVESYQERYRESSDAGRQLTKSQHQAAQAVLAQVSATVEGTEQDTKTHSSHLNETAKSQHDGKVKYFHEDQQAAVQATESLDKISNRGVTETQSATDAMRKTVRRWEREIWKAHGAV